MSSTATQLIPVGDIGHQLMERTFKGRPALLPFTRDLFLIETHIAGLAHYQLELVRDLVVTGLPLLLQREPANVHDTLAIEVFTQGRIKLGYVPRNRNPILARLMDAGKLLVAEVGSVGTWHNWSDCALPDVRLRISLRE